MQRNWIGRSLGRPGPLRSGRSRATRSRCSRPGPTRCSAPPSSRIAPDHPLTAALARDESRPRRVRGRVPARRHQRGRARDAGEARLRHRPALSPSVRCRTWLLPVYVANFVLMDYGTGAIFGCPAHDQRDLDFARRYGLPVMPVVLPPDADPERFEIGDRGLCRRGAAVPVAVPGRAGRRERKVPGHRRAREPGPRHRRDHLAAARLGRLAPALLGLPDPGDPLRELRRGAGAARRSCPWCCRRMSDFSKPGNPLERHPSWGRVDCPACGRPGRRARPTPSTRSWRVPGTSPGSPMPVRPICRSRKRLPTTGCRSTSISVALSMLCCICSTLGSTPARWPSAAISTWPSRSPACSRKA